ncbi:MAG: hydroxylamine reductase [Actinobacteria bacterium HGW-Actinobacteria-7]|nr:MAG: hydroxylamine reductase [Actinobacteria bacterium HGW-Actinobacteria-7]
MFCNQCEQTARGTGCDKVGVCGKGPDVAAVQDLLVHACRALAAVAVSAPAGTDLEAEGAFVEDALFTTLTNVDFDPETIAEKIDLAVQLRDALATRAGVSAGEFTVPADLSGKIELAAKLGSPWDTTRDPDVQSLQETTLYGLKGVAAYAHHARTLGHTDPDIDGYLFKALAALSDTSLDLGAWVGLALECGKVNLRTMEILDAANTGAYGNPEPTKVTLGQRPGHAILVSGHDLADLAALLEQTQGTGVDVYTHGEMLPSHAYPGLKKYENLVGHYGTAWQNQRKEFTAFPGAILMTTNCLMPPHDEYRDRVFTANVVNFPGLPHVHRTDFSAVIEKALAEPGFQEATTVGEVMVGFGHNTVLSVAPTVIEAVKSGAIRHFFLVGGCDGAKPGRNYYTEFVEQAPADTIILTLACGKFRFFDKDLGEIGGLPRLMDVGQCNDAYSAIKIAVALADAFECGVNDLPLSMILSWYEQKAVAILLTLLHLGISGIRLGPTLPAFITPNVLNVLVENFDIKPIAATAAEDLETILGKA